MAYDVQISERLARLTLHGQLCSADLAQIAEAIREIEERAEVTPHRITDLSNVTGITLDFAAMEVFAEKRRKAPLRNKVKSAIIAPEPLQFGFARMFQTLNDHPDITIVVFRDKESAEQWLAEEPKAGLKKT